MENVNVEKLVEDIKTGETAYRSGSWYSWCESRGLGQKWGDRFWPTPYAVHMTGLYTLRAFLRGRMHRKNPPAPLRDFHRSMLETGIEHELIWDMEKYNRDLAEKFSEAYSELGIDGVEIHHLALG